MVGQPLTSIVLKQMVAKDEVPSALLFDGPRGTGKTSAARILAMALNPDDRDSILEGTSLAVIEIDAASHGSVADIRNLVEQLKFAVGARKRVIILDEAHSITRDGFNALLKTLEEPPADTVFILVTTEPNRLPDTILSRVMEFEFRRVSPADLLSRVAHIAAHESFDVPRVVLAKIAEVSDGSVRDAVKYLDFVVRAEIDSVEQFVELIGAKDSAPLLFAAMLTGKHDKIFSVFDQLMMETGDPRLLSTGLNNLITDLFVLKAGGQINAAGKAYEDRLKLAKIIPADNLYSAVQILWDLKTRVRWSEDQRSALAAAIILMSEKLSSGFEQPAVVTADTTHEPVVESEPDAPRVLSLSELQQS